MTIKLRTLTPEEKAAIEKLARSRTAAAREVERTRMILLASNGKRVAVNRVDFLQQVEQWLPPDLEQVYAIIDNLGTHRATDVLLFSLQYPRWEFVFQPKYAAYLILIEPWWKVLRSLGLKGRRFETWVEVEQAIQAATAYWNRHRHPFVWGRRRRHQPRRQSGIAKLPKAA
jgi:hypothetical protein